MPKKVRRQKRSKRNVIAANVRGGPRAGEVLDLSHQTPEYIKLDWGRATYRKQMIGAKSALLIYKEEVNGTGNDASLDTTARPDK
jgi:hypothetical protein